jgi:hypothetical protein
MKELALAMAGQPRYLLLVFRAGLLYGKPSPNKKKLN